MATYTLNLELTGAEDVKSLLAQIKSSGGGDVFGFGKGNKKAKDAISEIQTLIKSLYTDMLKFRGKGIDLFPEFSGKIKEAGKHLKAMRAELKGILMDDPSSKSVGGGIKGIVHENIFERFEREHGDMFGSELDWKLREMRRRSDAAFAKSEKKEPANGGQQQPSNARLWQLHNQQIKAEAAAAAKALRDDTTFKKDMNFLLMPLFNPGSMWATMFSGRQTFSAMNTSHGAAFRSSMMGGMGAGAATGVLVAAATAIGFALKGLEKVVKETAKAFENARQLYAHALTTGMGLQFTAKRSMMASIIGVSEQDLFRFGAQMAYLNPKLEQAAAILAKTAVPLTQVSWEWKVLGADTEALFATLANKVQPALLDFINGLDVMVKFMQKHPDLVSKSYGANLGMYPLTAPAYYAYKAISAFGGLAGGSAAGSKMPGPQSWMKQLPASSWEKMGLVIGGGASNYAKETAKNTRDIAKDMRTLVANIVKGGPSKALTWGMSPQTANP